MKTLRLICALSLSLGILCCCTERNGSQLYTASLTEADSLMIPLDSITSQMSSNIQLINDSVLAFYNAPSSHLCLYDLKAGTTEKVKVFKTGPNAINHLDGFCYVSPDSIWIYEMWGKKLSLIDSDGTIKDRRIIPVQDGTHTVSIYPNAIRPYIVKGDLHYMQGYDGVPQDGKPFGTTLIYNAKDSTIFTSNPYPAVYGSAEDLDKWGVFEYRMTNYTMSPSDEMVISFPASDSIYVYNPKTDLRKAYFAGYSKPTNIHLVVSNDEISKYTDFMGQYNYSFILYDKYNDLYYRLMGIPTDDYDKEDVANELNRKKMAIIILDGNFEKVGETMLPQDCYLYGKSFINENGLHINVESDDDDFMKFRVFKPIIN